MARAQAPHPTESELPRPEPADESGHVIAGLRDSLDAMESVAEEMARASEAWASDGDGSVSRRTTPPRAEPASSRSGERAVEIAPTKVQ